MQACVVDTGGANLTSITNAIERLKIDFVISDKAADIKSATHVILPGVGSAKPIMDKLIKCNLIETIKNIKTPLLGICLGMQILFDYLEEDDISGLGVITGPVLKFPNDFNLSIPHMGWNQLEIKDNNTQLFQNINTKSYVFFAHSYYVPINKYTISETSYGFEYSSSVNSNNFFGVQFHPEKSGEIGSSIFKNFFKL
jgi:glutamine amidotransferase